jgi:bacillithiol system protein YtxJ
MGILDFLKSNTPKEISTFPWIPLIDYTQLTEIEGKTGMVSVIFKHSTRCGISRGVLHKFEKKHQNTTKEIKFYYLDLLNFRELSNEISKRFNIIHQSPQLILIKNGSVEIHDSHYEILEIKL